MPTLLETLRARIITGELAGGTRLNQADLADELGVSRIPVRDALQALAGEGFVTLGGRAGATVTELSVADLQELYELREAVEPLAARLGAPNLGRAQVRQMSALHADMEATADDLAWLDANTAFHAVLYERANRPRLVGLVENLRRQTDRYLRLHLAVIGNTAHLHAEHGRILDAARRGDAPAVEALTREHLATSHEFILTHLLEMGVSE